MDLNLEGKVALVTGAGQGVGRGIAMRLASEVCRIVVNDLFGDRATAVAAEIAATGGTAIEFAADITKHAQVLEMFNAMRQAFGPIDILVNNAGVPPSLRDSQAKRPRFVESTIEDQQAMVDLNVHGTMHCCREALRDMVAKQSGKIVSIISEAGRVGEARLAVYSGAKAAILGFTMALAREHGRDSINVNVIALGSTVHEGVKGAIRPGATPENNEALAKKLKYYPIGKGLRRVGRPEDVAFAVAFMASDCAAFITGQSLGVSGGFHMQ
ncbi:MAG: SDR family NAD(P)-dependent oxidoreductase [Betaproteobacteria bacterium]|nr:SDR family NAD(P)-dependent oxidoreductase [Betaproteobacteria bacterium]